MVNKQEIINIRKKLVLHNIYEEIKSIEELRICMSAHVFAVWDFMSLVKRLQSSMTCISLPWQNPTNPHAARLINEIVFYEESDIDHNGNPASHLDMYLMAMVEVEADSSMFENFIARLSAGQEMGDALSTENVPGYISKFVLSNVTCSIEGEIEEVASCFLFGREDAIPDMFTLFLQKWGINKEKIPALLYCLKRHIDIDSNEHGPAAQKILDELISGDASKKERASEAATRAIKGRISLWDGILSEIKLHRKEVSNNINCIESNYLASTTVEAF